MISIQLLLFSVCVCVCMNASVHACAPIIAYISAPVFVYLCVSIEFLTVPEDTHDPSLLPGLLPLRPPELKLDPFSYVDIVA